VISYHSREEKGEEEGDDESFAILLTTPFVLQITRPTRSLRMMRQAAKMNCEKQIGETIARVLTDSLLSQSSKSAQFFFTQKPALLILLLPDSTVKTLQQRVEISLVWTLCGIATRIRKPLCTSTYDEHTEETTLGLAFALTIISVSVSILREENGSLPAWFA
jgi:hypothetical protein